MTELLLATDLPYDDFEAMRALVGKTVHCSDGRQVVVNRFGSAVFLEDDSNGESHNIDGPCVIWENGSEEWYVDGKPHRLDGPAMVKANGYRAWWGRGRLHRLDGPAVVYADGRSLFYVDGIRVYPDDPRLMLGGEPV